MSVLLLAGMVVFTGLVSAAGAALLHLAVMAWRCKLPVAKVRR
jgi:hypothetical protein